MRRYCHTVGLMFWIVAGFCNLFFQLPEPRPPVDPNVYEQFFAQVAGIKHLIDSQPSVALDAARSSVYWFSLKAEIALR